MSRRSRRHNSGGRTGQHYNATPNLRSYSRSPAGPVTVIRPDGTVETKPPEKAVPSGTAPRRKSEQRRGPKSAPRPVPAPTMKQLLTVDCPACSRRAGEPCTLRQGHRARVEMYLAATGKRSTPEKVVTAVQEGARVREEKLAARRRPVSVREQMKRTAQKEAAADADRRRAAKGYPGTPAKSVNTRAVKPDFVQARRCRRCGAAVGVPCAATTRDGRPASHQERVQDARRELAQRRS